MKKKNGLDYFNTFNTLKKLKPKKNWRQKGEVERGKKRCRDRRISLGTRLLKENRLPSHR